jgi:hypothetical protein
MRSLSLVSLCSILCLFPLASKAGAPLVSDSAGNLAETYRGYFLDLSVLAGRKEFAVMADVLRHQIDTVEGVAGLSPRVLEFFRTVPITVNEIACLDATKDKDGKDIEEPKALLHAACYGGALPEHSESLSAGSPWDSNKSRWTNSDPVALALDTGLGVIMVRPIMLDRSSPTAQRPVILHELLHAYHNRILPQGYRNAGILLHHNRAREGNLYPADAYLMTNEREFFAVTASVFLHGNDEQFRRSTIKEKQPDYYRYLVNLFGFDPEPGPSSSPLALAQ